MLPSLTNIHWFQIATFDIILLSFKAMDKANTYFMSRSIVKIKSDNMY
jgi:hypothetical protein